MPGQTNNQTLLAANNQEIVALNEIKTAIEAIGTPVVIVDYSGLEQALSDLGETIALALENLNMNITQNNNCGCCGSGGTSTPIVINVCPTPPGDGQPGGGGPGDPPGDGQTPPSGTPDIVALRRCKVATLMIDNYLHGVSEYGDTYNFDTYINVVVAAGGEYVAQTVGAMAGAAIVGAMSQILTPGPTPDDIFWVTLGAAMGSIIGHLVATNGTIEFNQLSEFTQNNREKLICALAKSSNGFSARSALMSAIDSISPGLDPGNRAFVDRMFPSPLVALLFFVDNRYQVLEAALDKMSDECPCDDDTPIETTPTNDYKCRAANYIFDSFTDTLTNWNGFSEMSWYSVASFITALGSGLLRHNFAGIFGLLSGVLLAIVPPLISKLGQLYWRGTDYFTPFAPIAGRFIANKEVIICELFEAQTVSAAKAALENRITDYVGSVMTDMPDFADEQDTYVDAVTALLPTSVLNELFKTGEDERAEIATYEPEGYFDCSCGGGGTGCDYVKDPNDAEVYGTSADLPLNISTKEGGAPGYLRQYIAVVINADDWSTACGDIVNNFTITSNGLTPDTTGVYDGFPVIIYSDDGVAIYEANTFPSQPINLVRGISVRSTTAGSVTINYS